MKQATVKLEKAAIENTDAATVPNRLRELRMHGVVLTQEEVARIRGIAHTTVSRHESGERALSADDIEMYAKLYRVETYEIFMPKAPSESEK